VVKRGGGRREGVKRARFRGAVGSVHNVRKYRPLACPEMKVCRHKGGSRVEEGMAYGEAETRSDDS